MKLNLKDNNFFLLLILLLPLFTIKGQKLIDVSVENKKNDIIEFLIKEKELLGNPKDFSKMIYAQSLNPKCGFYKIGITSSHGKPYLMIYNNNTKEILKTKDFRVEVNIILGEIENSNCCSKDNILLLLKEILEVYNENFDMYSKKMILPDNDKTQIK